ncbi:hypothetical protein [Halococcus saccharolyticus]|uniref:Uncharacterized protein n=1 Tax=Halococcus saccharolyticus DSM 5350 TaxID=1227455 RepID=M0MNN1_9EURY|nr:hypothetical protein [Halococcus saccharolyticus]EMA47271.1 hypothetical protein C449_02375 [Halococcus saccharolyticus DSM 5350]
MSLDDLTEEIESRYDDLGDETTLRLDRETRNELALLQSALDLDDADELLRRAVHQFFQATVETGRLDFHLRSGYDVTYDEYLSGMTYDEMTGDVGLSDQAQDDVQRYQY